MAYVLFFKLFFLSIKDDLIESALFEGIKYWKIKNYTQRMISKETLFPT